MEAVTFAGVPGRDRRLVPERRRLPPAPPRVARQPGVALPQCGTPVKPYDNIPILSWLLLRGHCRSCSAPISPRYPLVEALTAALCVGAVLAHRSAAGIALSVALILIVVPAALIDLEHRIIPNRITALGAVLALVIGLALDPAGEPERLIAGAAAGGFLLLAALAYPGGMGMGDVKLAAVMGLFLGRAVAPAILIALLAGVLVGAVVIARKGRARGARRRSRSAPSWRSARWWPYSPGSRSSTCTSTTSCTKGAAAPAPIGLKRPRRADSPILAGDPTVPHGSAHQDASFPEPQPRPPLRRRRRRPGHPARLRRGRAGARQRLDPRRARRRAAARPPTPCARARSWTRARSARPCASCSRQRSEQARARRRRQPAHRAAHARAAPGDRPQGARRRRALPGPGPGADAAEQRRSRLPPARHRRHARRPPPAGRARGRPARHGRTPARRRPRRRPAPGGHRPLRLRADPLALPSDPDPEHAGRVLCT